MDLTDLFIVACVIVIVVAYRFEMKQRAKMSQQEKADEQYRDAW